MTVLAAEEGGAVASAAAQRARAARAAKSSGASGAGGARGKAPAGPGTPAGAGKTGPGKTAAGAGKTGAGKGRSALRTGADAARIASLARRRPSARGGAPAAAAAKGPTHTLTAQFLICFAVLCIGTIVPTPAGRPQEGVPHLMVKGSALSLLFFVLALTAATGQKAARAASGLGALVTVGYVLTSPDAHNIASWVAGFYGKPGTAGAGVPTAAVRDSALVEYTPAVPYPWALPDGSAAGASQSGPPAAGELVA